VSDASWKLLEQVAVSKESRQQWRKLRKKKQIELLEQLLGRVLFRGRRRR
jgi:hypothetical protein